MHARVIDQNVDRALLQHRLQRLLHAGCVAHIKRYGLRLPACGHNFCGHGPRLAHLAVGMHPHVAAALRQAARNGRAYVAAAAGNQGMAWTRAGTG